MLRQAVSSGHIDSLGQIGERLGAQSSPQRGQPFTTVHLLGTGPNAPGRTIVREPVGTAVTGGMLNATAHD
jgi:hypothetical protein